MGRRGRVAWAAAFAVSGLLWVVSRPWLDEGSSGPPEVKVKDRGYVCVSGSTDPSCAWVVEDRPAGLWVMGEHRDSNSGEYTADDPYGTSSTCAADEEGDCAYARTVGSVGSACARADMPCLETWPPAR